MPEAAADPVAHHGSTDGPGDDEPRLGRRAVEVSAVGAVHDEQRWTRAPGAAATRAQRCGELAAAPQPGRGREHAGQAESRERPLARRPARMARPARVRIRRRNPWVFARRRLFGWKVRLLTRGLPYDGLERRRRCRCPAAAGLWCRAAANRLLSDIHDPRTCPNAGHQGQHGHATAAVGTARPAHGTCARPGWSNRPARALALPSAGSATTYCRPPRSPGRRATRCRWDTSWQKKRPVVDNRLLGSPEVVSVAIRWEASPPNSSRFAHRPVQPAGTYRDAAGGSAVQPVYTGCG